MRKIALVKNNHSEIKRVMLYKDEHGVYLFGYDKMEDCSALWDEWYETIEDAYKVCKEEYGIQEQDWKQIPDPLENCAHDWIEPVRVKNLEKGKLETVKLEKLVNGIWVDIK